MSGSGRDQGLHEIEKYLQVKSVITPLINSPWLGGYAGRRAKKDRPILIKDPHFRSSASIRGIIWYQSGDPRGEGDHRHGDTSSRTKKDGRDAATTDQEGRNAPRKSHLRDQRSPRQGYE
ncbi:hypothetical protein ACMD2_22664 [Ananas comosus]|uniref:Uncharacterized protein n=1 Tax=Ananas comosus TaxID=4615 RepID=A0A199VJ62_ANACO|nr:hypothetical protein ACMD2_22664 [Ananas comosus]